VNSEEIEVDWNGLERLRWRENDPIKEDEEIKKAIEATFLFDPRVLSFNPEVEVRAGVVTLTGVVDNPAAKQAAGQDARNTVGVWQVRNLLKVRPLEKVSDETMEDNLDKAFRNDAYLDRREIAVSVDNDKVLLRGNVDSRFEKARAETLATRVRGVAEVYNQLKIEEIVTARQFETDWDIRHKIHDELWWSPFVDANQVHVGVRDGVATLTGEVDSYTERGAAVENAYEGGARKVNNYLEVENSHH